VEAWELLLAFAAAFVAGYFGSMLGLVLGTLRLPFIVIATGSPLAAAGTNIAISAAAAGAHDVNPLTLVYLNRLSDLLFILARAANAADGHEEPLWRPGSSS